MGILNNKRTKTGLKRPFPEQWRVQIDRAISKHAWTVIADREQFVLDVCGDLSDKLKDGGAQEQVTADVIERAAIRRYCHVLYDACASKDRQVQERALQEVWHHLYHAGLFKTHDRERAKDAGQQALVNVWKHLDQCRDKGSFISWCNLILLNVVREQYRKATRRGGKGGTRNRVREELVLAEVGNSGEEVELADSRDGNAGGEDMPFGLAATSELHARLLVAIRACLESKDQRTVVIESFFNDRSFKELAQTLGTSPGNVQVMKSRALKKLRRCPGFVRLYEELLDV